MKISIVGAGAAGCFCSILLKRRMPEAVVEVFEAGRRPLAKVAVTGGGRCNLTNSFKQIQQLKQAYPRGEQLMKRALRRWSVKDTMDWFEKEGVRLLTQDDECVFPVSQDAMQIVNTLLLRMREEGVVLHTSHKISSIIPEQEGYLLSFADERQQPRHFDKVVCTMGGCPTLERLSPFRLLEGLSMANPVPSLFTFCIKDCSLTSLMGCVVDAVSVSIAGTKIRAAGALLVTHWGVSGPAILRLSSYAARHLADNNYRAQLCVNWLNTNGEQEAMDQLQDIQQACSRRQVGNEYPRQFTAKLWQHLLGRAHIDLQKRWNELSNRDLNRLCATLTADVYQIEGKGQYKEEFVTCGGIDLASININTLEARQHPGLYFAGELLDVDGITGGFNLQAAWSMAAVIAEEVTQNNA